MKNESTSSGTGSNQHLSSAGTRYVSTELDEGSLYPEQPQVHRRSPSNLLSPDAGPSQQIGLIPAEPSPKTSDDNAGESSDKGDGRRKKLTKKQAQELEEIFQADHSGAPGRRAAIARQFGVSQQQIATWFQNRRARERNRELHQDFQTVQKCLKAAFEENQMLRKELDELRAEHALCGSRGDAPGPAAPPPPPAPLDNLPAAPDPRLYRHFSPPLTLTLPQKRPTRSVSEPALPKRARLPPSEPTAFSGPPLQAPLTVPALSDYSMSSDLRFGGDLFTGFASAPPPPPLVSAPLPTTTSPLGGLTLDEAFRDLLRADPMASTAAGGPAFSAGAQGFGGSADPFGLLAGGGGRSIRPPSPFGMPNFEGAGNEGMGFQTDSLQELAPDVDATSQALSQEDFNLPPWWEK